MENYTIEPLNNLTVDDIVRKINQEEVITPEETPFHNVRNNLKIFLIYHAKSQLERVIKLTKYLEMLEDRVMSEIQSSSEIDPDVVLRAISTLQLSVDTSVKLIDKISTNDSYISLIYNDNRQQLIDNSRNLTSNRIEISKDSREKLRKLAATLLASLNTPEK